MQRDVDALFKLPLGEFTSARNALVARLKKAGQIAAAAEAKAVSKPSVSAWVVNQLYWRHGYLFGRLLDAGERLRQAQTTRQSSDARELVNVRREVVIALVTVAADILREGDYGDARNLMRRVTSTLEALSAYGSLPGAPSAGRLTADLEPPGFETLAGFVPPSDPIKPRASKSPPAVRKPGGKESARGQEQQRLVAAAKSAVRQAERELAHARKQSERAAARVKTAVLHAKTSEGQRIELERQLARATKEAQAARDKAIVAEAEAGEATQAAERAEQAVELARSRLQQLAGKRE